MGKNKKPMNDFSGLVFSTNPDYQPPQDDDDEVFTEARFQKIRIFLDRKKRKGKAVTVIVGFEGKDSDLSNYCRTLKKLCGVGGSAKDEEIILQGDQRQKALKFFKDEGFNQAKLAGG